MTEYHEYDALIAEVRDDLAEAELPPLSVAKARVQALRDFREFALLIEIAERYIMAWPDAAVLTKFYGQALIDHGQPRAGAAVLRQALCDIDPGNGQFDDICGVLGRAEKELCQEALRRGLNAQAEAHGRAAFDAYYDAFQRDPGANYYQGINAAAMVAFCNDEGLRIGQVPSAVEIAKELISKLSSNSDGNPWAVATLAEAHIPLADWESVETHLAEYLNMDVTPFQIMGTARQFRDVWRLGARGGRGRQILAMLDAVTLSGEQGFRTASVPIPTEGAADIDRGSLEKVLGADGMKTYEWLRDGFDRAESVAAVLNPARRRIGTAFVIKPEEFGIEVDEDELCLMTNYHVLNEKGEGDALALSAHPRIRFEANRALGRKVFSIARILFESPFDHTGLDCAIFTVKGVEERPRPIPMEADLLPDPEGDPKPRVYIIGHPSGGEMQFSLQDNRLLDHEGPDQGKPPIPERCRIHYFAPTEPGSSGSPVFDAFWNCIALHHAGLKHDPDAGLSGMARLNGKSGHHSANEGIAISSIVAAARGS